MLKDFVAHRGCDRTLIRLFIINDLLRCLFGKAVPKAVLSCKIEHLYLACELRAKPVPPVPNRFIAYIYSTLMKRVFYVTQWKWKSQIQHWRHPDDLWTGLEVAKGKSIGYSWVANCNVYCGKAVYSENAVVGASGKTQSGPIQTL